MNRPIVEVENLAKLYRLGTIGATTLRDSVERWWYRARGQQDRLRRFGARPAVIEPGHPQAGPEPNTIWALKDVSFSVNEGEVLGIIGRNGAGKSTLLKILSRITDPTAGRAVVRGRVASLLEVGTGFHPELTGRENTYLNGAILGMKKAEVDRKFDEIVSFAEIERFIDTPVKRYSSGMYVRLAFAVAAHLEPEVLLIDEVLAVGDAIFQKKCLGRMKEVAGEGRTVLYVSHNMPSVVRLCSRALWIRDGRIALAGTAEQAVASYLQEGAAGTSVRVWNDPARAPGNDRIRLRSARVTDTRGNATATVDVRRPFLIEIEYAVREKLPPMRISFTVSTSDGLDVFTSADSADPAWTASPRPPGRYVSTCTIPGNLLKVGRYVARVGADIPFREVLFVCDAALEFEVGDTGGPGRHYPEKWAGVICPELPWHVVRTENSNAEAV